MPDRFSLALRLALVTACAGSVALGASAGRALEDNDGTTTLSLTYRVSGRVPRGFGA